MTGKNDIKVLALVGGICSNSLNKRLYNELVKYNPTSLQFSTFEIEKLPFFTQDLENSPTEAVMKLQKAVREADATLFITPEYNRSFPGVLKNAIDWATRPYGQNLWKDKPVAVIGASTGRIGTFGAQQHLRGVCNFLNMRLMNQPEFYFDASSSMDENGLLPLSIDFVQLFLRSFEEWIIR
jgi:chromate reductase